ncbi:DUF397 domain-containing protein [Streptomyces sp. BI20]|uniref:DUF397 domain-containing protein n=1 Tax=Streptomyces sp. BI20 TaxID=3403460 RepID=UPI003C746FE4
MAVQRTIGSGPWLKSSYSGEHGSDCLEVCRRPGVVGVRDSKCVEEARYAVVTVSGASWEAFARYIAP